MSDLSSTNDTTTPSYSEEVFTCKDNVWYDGNWVPCEPIIAEYLQTLWDSVKSDYPENSFNKIIANIDF